MELRISFQKRRQLCSPWCVCLFARIYWCPVSDWWVFIKLIHTLVEMPCKNNRVYKYDRPQHSATHLVWTEESAQNRSSVIVQREQLEIGVRQVTCDYDYDEEDNDCDDYMRRIMKTHCAKHHGQNDSSTQISSNCLPLAPWVPHLVVLKIKMIICFPSSHIVTCYSRGEVSLTLFLIIFSPIDPLHIFWSTLQKFALFFNAWQI